MRCSFLFAGSLAALISFAGLNAVDAQVGNSTSPSTTNPSQPGLGSAQPGTSQTQAQSAGSTGSSQPASQTTAADAGHSQQGGDDGLLAAWLIVDNEGEIAISQLGQQRAENSEVKQFAERMVKDHTEMLTKLQSAAGQGRQGQDAAAVAGQAGQGGQAQASAQAQADVQGRRSSSIQAGMAGGDSMAATIKRELGAQCLQSKQQELSQKQGADFDKCFMEMQLAMHMEAVDTLKVFQRHASGELRRIIDEGIQTTSAHLEHAKSIKMKLEGKTAEAHEAKP